MNLLCCVVMFVLKKVRLSIIKIKKKRFCYQEWPRTLFNLALGLLLHCFILPLCCSLFDLLVRKGSAL